MDIVKNDSDTMSHTILTNKVFITPYLSAQYPPIFDPTKHAILNTKRANTTRFAESFNPFVKKGDI